MYAIVLHMMYTRLHNNTLVQILALQLVLALLETRFAPLSPELLLGLVSLELGILVRQLLIFLHVVQQLLGSRALHEFTICQPSDIRQSCDAKQRLGTPTNLYTCIAYAFPRQC